MVIADGNERRYITLPISYWSHLEAKADESKRSNPYYGGRHTVSKMIENMVKTDIEMKKAGFLSGK